MLKKSTLENIIRQDLSPLWEILSQEEKRTVTDNFRVFHFKKNEMIYAEGDAPEYLWILLRGKVKKTKTGIGDRVQILRLYRPVQYFGYRAFFAEEYYQSSATAQEMSMLGALPLSIVENLLNNNARLAMFFIHDLSRNLGGSDSKIVSLTQKHIRGRLADALLLLASNFGMEDDEATIKIFMSREDLANLSNMTTSNAIRTLSCFVKEKLIVVDGRRIKIIDEGRLRKISKFG